MMRCRATQIVLGSFVVVLGSACVPPSGSTVTTAPPDAGGAMLDARLLQMVDTRRTDTAVIDEALGDPSPARRARAALAIGQVKARARYPALRRLLLESDTAIAANAAFALGIAKDTGSVASLARAVAGASAVVAREAAWSLGEIGEPARAVITIALGDGISNPLSQSTAAQRAPAERAALLLSAVKLRPVPVGVVRAWLADTSAEVVRAAAYTIGRPRLPGGARALLTVRAHPDEEVRQHVARGLARQATGDSLATLAREALVAMLSDSSPRVRVNAARSLGSFGPSALRDVERALGDADANVRVGAAELAQTVFGRDTVVWQRVWNRDTTFRVRQQLMAAARAGGLAVYETSETEWSTHRDWRRRAAALEARTAAPRADRMAIARAFASDPDARVRVSALRLLPATSPDSAVRALTGPALNDAALSVRTAAMSALIGRARAVDVERALDMLPLARAERDEQARATALRVIAAAWVQDSANVSPSIRQRLAQVNDQAPAVQRRLVAKVTPMTAWANAEVMPVARALGEYEKLVRRWQVPGARQPVAVIHTDYGQIRVELFGADAPLIVESFVNLANSGFYRNTTFHRVVPNFVVQDGDASGGDGAGPGYTLRESFSRRRHERGSVGLATSGPDTGGSQYYLCHSTQPHLDGAYTVFGRVLDGQEIMDRIVQGDRMIRIEIK